MQRGKKGAFEMSMTTMIVIVLSVIFLIMALVLVRNIFGGATSSVDQINTQVSKEINKLFTDENKKIVIYLGSDKTAKIKAGTSNFGLAIGAQTKYGNPIDNRSDIQYKLELDKNSECYKNVGLAGVQRWFVQQKISGTTIYWNNIDEAEVDKAYARILISIPEGTEVCTQRVLVDFVDNTNKEYAEESNTLGLNSFTIEVIKSGLF